MLNFLRKLRRNNMNTKYLKYAIGEIVLVVIGIFIAVQINNWNEDRKEQKTLNALLELLKGDLNEDLEELKKLDSMFTMIELGTDTLLNQFKTIEPISSRSGSLFINLLIETNFKSQQNAYEILKESGNFSKLPISLQNELMLYYATAVEIKARENISNAFIRDKYEPTLFSRYPSFFGRGNNAKQTQEVYSNDPRPLDHEVMFRMFNDREVEVLSFGRMYQIQKQLAQYKLAVNEVKRILAILD